MKIDIQDFVETYDTFQRNKRETIKIPGALQPLSTLTHIWGKIAMDFIVGLSRAGNKSMIMVVVDSLSKYAHLCALPHSFIPP
jgi:hypothetical protein